MVQAHIDVSASILLGDALGQPNDSGLGGAVVGLPNVAHKTHHR